jgi:hypothetical protein
MRDRALITTGVVGGALAAICCATPCLANASRRHLRGGTGANNDEVIAIHVPRLAARVCDTDRLQSVQDK